jgi:hypothetical protein
MTHNVEAETREVPKCKLLIFKLPTTRTPELSGVELYAFLGSSGWPHAPIFSLPLSTKRGEIPDFFRNHIYGENDAAC